MAEFNDYVTYGQLTAVVDRLDKRISNRGAGGPRNARRYSPLERSAVHLALGSMGRGGRWLYPVQAVPEPLRGDPP